MNHNRKRVLVLAVAAAIIASAPIYLTACGGGGGNGTVKPVVNDFNETVPSDSASTDTSDLGGSGSLTLSGGGTLVLTGTNTYTGGTTINASTLQLGDGGTSGSIVGNVTDNGSLVFDRSDAVTFGGVVSGAGSLTQAGTGTLTLTGTNAYSGGTNIKSGVLQISSDANLGATIGSVLIDNATLRALGSFALSQLIDVQNTAYIDTNGYALTLDNAVDGIDPGQGTLVKMGAGTLTITGSGGPEYGSTKIEEGTLALSYQGAISDGSLSVASGATFDISQALSGGSFFSLSGGGTIALGGRLLQIEGGNTSWTFDGVITDGGIGGGSFGSVAINQPNVTGTLTSVNTYTGATYLYGGTLALAGHGSIADSSLVSVGGTLDISGAIGGATITALTGDGSVVLGGQTLTVSDDTSDDADGFSGVISGTGNLVVAGGHLTLTGANTYTGATTINSSAILRLGDGQQYTGDGSISGGSIVGNITDNGSLIFDNGSVIFGQYAGMTYGGVISGTGSLTLTGNSTLTLTGANTYSGGTVIDAGSTLQVGSPTSGGSIEGDVVDDGVLTFINSNNVEVVPSGATLAGTGTVMANVDNYGTVTSSGSTSAQGLTIFFNLTDAAGSTTAVSLGDPLKVYGAATVAGTLEVLAPPPNYIVQSTENLITAGSVSGTFADLTFAPGVFYTGTLAYTPTQVNVNLTQTSVTASAAAVGIVDSASVSAAQRVQVGFDSINNTMASGGTLSPDVMQGAGAIQHSATPAVAQATLQSLSGQLHAASAAMLFDGIDASGNALSEHFDDLVGGGARPGVWYSDLGGQGDLQRSGYAGATFRSSGGVAGADMRIGAHALFGFAAGQSLGFGQLDAAWDHNRTWMNNIAMYGGLVNGPWYASAQVANGWYREDMQRLLQLGALGSLVGTGSTGRYVAGAVEGGRTFQIGMTRVVPFADVRYQRLDLGGFTEQGGLGYGLVADARSVDRLQAGLGLRAERGWRLANGMRVQFDGSVGWQHALHQYGSVFDASFTGFNDWLPVEGIGLSRNTAILRAGLSLWPTRNFGLRVGYMREQDQQERAGSAMLQGTVTF